MVFSNESIKKIREKNKNIVQPEIIKSSPLSLNGSSADIKPDVEGRVKYGHWLFGIQMRSYPYELLKRILDCLKELGFVYKLVNNY